MIEFVATGYPKQRLIFLTRFYVQLYVIIYSGHENMYIICCVSIMYNRHDNGLSFVGVTFSLHYPKISIFQKMQK